MGVVAVLKLKKSAVTKLFTALDDSNIDKVVSHIEKLSKGKVIRTRWRHEVGNRLTLNLYMGLDWNYQIEHIISQIPQIPSEIIKCELYPGGLYVSFDKEPSAFLYTHGDSEALGMHLERTYYRLRRVEGKTALMIAALDDIDGSCRRYYLRKELWMQA